REMAFNVNINVKWGFYGIIRHFFNVNAQRPLDVIGILWVTILILIALLNPSRSFAAETQTPSHSVLAPADSSLEYGPHIGLAYDDFPLTLAPGERTEAAGPFFYTEDKETEKTWAVPPLLSYSRDPAVESKEF